MTISVEVILGDGTRRMSTISDPLILSEQIARHRAMAELYAQWLIKKIRSIEVPTDFNYAEGDVHEIDNPRVGIQCQAVCRSMTHIITPTSMTTRMGLETCKRFE